MITKLNLSNFMILVRLGHPRQTHGNSGTEITKPHLTGNNSAYEWLLKSTDEYCFISVIGKSRFGKSLSQVLLPLLRPKRDFRRIAYFDECGIDFYWSGL